MGIIKNKQDAMLRGANPRGVGVGKVQRAERGAALIMPPPAPSHPFVADKPSNKVLTPVQAALVHGIARNKITSKTGTGAASWNGKRYSS